MVEWLKGRKGPTKRASICRLLASSPPRPSTRELAQSGSAKGSVQGQSKFSCFFKIRPTDMFGIWLRGARAPWLRQSFALPGVDLVGFWARACAVAHAEIRPPGRLRFWIAARDARPAEFVRYVKILLKPNSVSRCLQRSGWFRSSPPRLLGVELKGLTVEALKGPAQGFV